MRHYEIVFLVHPDRSDQVADMIERYRAIFQKTGGTIHRLEDWGRRQLAYPIKKIHKAHYVLMNVECDQKALKELKDIFQYNDDILRYLILVLKNGVTKPSPVMRGATHHSERGGKGGQRSGGKRRGESEKSFKKESPAKVEETENPKPPAEKQAS